MNKQVGGDDIGVDADGTEDFVDQVMRRVADRRRLDAVAKTGLLDTGPETGFDRIATFASELLSTPFGFITVVDETRSFWKACIGVDATELADRQNTVGESFCQYVIGTDDAFLIDDTRLDARTKGNPSIESMGVLAWAGVPLRSESGEVLGTVCVVDTKVRCWTDRDREVLFRLAEIASGEIASRQAHMELRRSTALLATILERSPLGFALFNSDLRFAMINEALAGINGGSVTEHVGRTIGEVFPEGADYLTRLVRKVFETGEALTGIEVSGFTPAQPGVQRTWSTSFFRVDVDERPLGVGALVADVTERTRARRRAERLARFTRRLASVEELDELVEIVSSEAPPYLEAEFVALGTLGPKGETLSVAFSGIPAQFAGRSPSVADETPYGRCVRTGEAVLIGDRIQRLEEYPVSVELADALECESSAAVPLIASRGNVIGVLIVGWKRAHVAGDFPVPQLNVMADAIAQTLERTQRSAEHRDLTTSLQRTLLSPAPTVKGLDLAVRYRPAGSALGFGGDWYDVVSIDAHRSALIVGDVVGHDSTSAARMAHVRTIVSALIQLGTPLNELFDTAERLLSKHDSLEDDASNMHATVGITIVDTRHRTLTTVLAGHPPPIMLKPDGSACLLAHSRRPLLGFSGETPSPDAIPYETGSTLVAYSDGLIESRTHDIDHDIEQLRSFVTTLTKKNADESADEILAQFAHPSTQDDDIALLIACL